MTERSRRAIARLADWFWVDVPVAAGRLSISLRGVMGDGNELRGRPVWGAAVPLAGVAAGFCAGAFHGGRVYTESIAVLAALGFAAGFGSGAGVWTLAGFAVGDAFVFSGYDASGGLFATATGWQRVGPLAVSYTTLAALMVFVPLSATGVRLAAKRRLAGLFGRRWSSALGLTLQFALLGLLAYLWTAAAPFMVRPLWRFQGWIPAREAVRPLQENGWMVAVAMVAAGALRLLVTARSQCVPLPPVQAPHSRWLPLPIGAVLKGGFFTLMLGGLWSGGVRAAIVWAWLTCAFLTGPLLSRTAPPVARVIRRIPVLLRLGAVCAVAWGLGTLAERQANTGVESFDSFLLAVLVSFFVFNILTPPAERQEA